MQFVKEEIKSMSIQDIGGYPKIQQLSLSELTTTLEKEAMLKIQFFPLNAQQDIQEIYARSVKL